VTVPKPEASGESRSERKGHSVPRAVSRRRTE
jgi:hypothetical protein